MRCEVGRIGTRGSSSFELDGGGDCYSLGVSASSLCEVGKQLDRLMILLFLDCWPGVARLVSTKPTDLNIITSRQLARPNIADNDLTSEEETENDNRKHHSIK